MTHPPLHIGILLVPPIQLLDLAPIDLFAMLSHSYFSACNLPAPLLALALPDASLKISYIAHTGPSTTSAFPESTTSNTPESDLALGPPALAPTTAHLNLEITAALTDPAVAPGHLDILLIPGPLPDLPILEVVCEFVRQHVGAGVDLLTVCTGVFVAAQAGVLDGRRATGPRGVVGVLRERFGSVVWVDRRWVRDGEGGVWTSGGITNGMDMVATYLRYRFPGALSDTVIKMAEVEIRPEQYEQRKPVFMASFVWLVFKAWVAGLVRGGKSKEKAS
ncbi:class I glutamine amidotransferase-like protein [Lophiostoma macrostomum CBS 122681]|uniref:Class I glutamine amidotransferase-like protein n=1 Tax=Lophiostoma macrostomum CBS 122681 TaxID=1314788 RepID=A0A6A6T590_9PLEO|nr:class I glutamine amidotransferase-like protein [Lophiostoma macrostomum CBS 122681]